MTESLSSQERIRRRAEFQRVYEHGTRTHSRFMTLFILANDLAVTRLGVAATRKLGDAVHRNRAKRLVRELFRRNKTLPGLDVVVVPRRELLDAEFSSLEADYRAALRRRPLHATPRPRRERAAGGDGGRPGTRSGR
ncbi:MAG: ribonuclease P protein component [Bacteroidales bacterium]